MMNHSCQHLNSTINRQLKKINRKTKIKILSFIFICACFSIFFSWWHSWKIPLVSPFIDSNFFEFISLNKDIESASSNNKVIYGFLPYWNIDDVTIQPELTNLSYFGLNVDSDGTILTTDQDNMLHPGYARLDSQQLWQLAQELNTTSHQIEITLVQFDSDKIEQIINHPQAHENLITALDSLLLAYPISGFNIDFEYNGEITPELRANFVLLIGKIRTHLDAKYTNVQLSIDMYASASNNEQLWDVPKIAQSVDYIIVMAYDFHRRSSLRAGPVAPLFSHNNQWGDNIHQNLREFLRYVPKEKILLGIPFYGYEWQVDEWSPNANTYPDSGMTASYERVKKLLTDPNLNIETCWDEQALCPYLTYVNDDEIRVIYYENPTSIEYKLEYVKQLDLGGIAIWALGYEGSDRDLWEVIKF